MNQMPLFTRDEIEQEVGEYFEPESHPCDDCPDAALYDGCHGCVFEFFEGASC